jgi:ribosomal protein S18 acetylase RimI-like enzyme
VDDIIIRRAEKRDLAQVAGLAGRLVRMHHAVDPARFLLVEKVEEGYAWWFSRELARTEAIVLVAQRASVAAGSAGTAGTVRDGPIVGYVYGTLEDRDWNLLLDNHGALHDIFVAEEARSAGIGRKLVEAAVAALKALGAPRIVLSTMVGNEPAQRLFRACGFRPTMLEMTRSDGILASTPERMPEPSGPGSSRGPSRGRTPTR